MKQKSRLAQMACSLWFLPFFTGAQVNVLTYHNDNGRLGANLNETQLTPANVNAANFGQLFSYTVDGYVFAQPLYVSALSIPGHGTHNVVYVATEHNSVYAFDADSNVGSNGGLLWHVNLGPSASAPGPGFPFRAIQPEVGITGTPVIDLPSQTLYVDAFTQNGANFTHSIHALSILDGSEKPGSPLVVSVSIHATGAGSTGGTLKFQAVQELQRCALTLANGILYVAYAGYTDTQQTDPFHGWIIGFDASNLQLLPNFVFNSTPNGTKAQFGSIAGEGGIWMGGGGLAADDNNNLFFATGDGNFNAFPNTHGTEYGDSVIKLSTSGGLSVADYFTPFNQATFESNDEDVGSGGVILLPDQPGPYPHLMIQAGKPQEAYVVNRDMMTTDGKHINTSGQQDNIVQEMPLGNGSYDTPAYFNEQIYYVATKDVIRSYMLSNGTLIADLPGTFGTRTFSFPGATPSISANGADSGIVWAVQNANPAILVAYDANDLSSELYNSTQAGTRDQLTGGVKFAVPTVANGKVYVGSQGALSIFGLLDANPPPQWNPVAASYGGLFFESSGVEFGASGAVSITMTKRGAYSGKLQFGANNYSFHGTFDANGATTSNISQKKGGASLTVTLQVNTNDNNWISGTVSSDSWSANLFANRSVFKGHGNPAPSAGTYTVTFPGPGDGNPNNPQNDGTGTVTVNASGKTKFKGVLGDGTKVTQSADVSETGDWPLFISLYARQGEIIGWLNLNGTNVSGQTTWIKQANPKSKSFPAGFMLNTSATGAPK